MYILVAILLIIVLVFGVSSGMQSYATAKQAQAQIEVAQVAQVSAWGNLIVILILALVIVCVLALVVWMVYSRQRLAISGQQSVSRQQRSYNRALSQPVPPAPPMSLDLLIQLETLKTLRSMNGNGSTDGRDASTSLRSAQRDDEELFWLRQ